MIIPPADTACFYSIFFEGSAAKYLVNLLPISFTEDIHEVLLTSQYIDGDIKAIDEVQSGTRAVINDIQELEEKNVCDIVYNQLYFPNSKNIDITKIDKLGDIAGVDGYENPFVLMKLTCDMPANLFVIDASVNYVPFILPNINDFSYCKNIIPS